MKKIIEFLNTNLGIWFLSSIMIGAISFTYSFVSNKLVENSKREESISRLRIEVIQRIDQAGALVIEFDNQYLGSEAQLLEAETQNKIHEFVKIIDAFLRPPSASSSETPFRIYSGFQEFNNRPLRSLLIELSIIDVKNRNSILKLLKWTTDQTRLSLDELDIKELDIYIDSFEKSIDPDYWDIDLGLFRKE